MIFAFSPSIGNIFLPGFPRPMVLVAVCRPPDMKPAALMSAKRFPLAFLQ